MRKPNNSSWIIILTPQMQAFAQHVQPKIRVPRTKHEFPRYDTMSQRQSRAVLGFDRGYCMHTQDTESLMQATTHFWHLDFFTDLEDFAEAAFAQQVHKQIAAVQNVMMPKPALLLIPHPFQLPAALQLHWVSIV